MVHRKYIPPTYVNQVLFTCVTVNLLLQEIRKLRLRLVRQAETADSGRRPDDGIFSSFFLNFKITMAADGCLPVPGYIRNVFSRPLFFLMRWPQKTRADSLSRSNFPFLGTTDHYVSALSFECARTEFLRVTHLLDGALSGMWPGRPYWRGPLQRKLKVLHVMSAQNKNKMLNAIVAEVIQDILLQIGTQNLIYLSIFHRARAVYIHNSFIYIHGPQYYQSCVNV